MLELVVLLGAGIGAAGFGGMWVKTRRRTNHGNTKVAVDKFDNAAGRVSAAQARWYDLMIELPIVGGGLLGLEKKRLDDAEDEARTYSRKLYDLWLPISDVSNDDVASFNDVSREEVAAIKVEALEVVDEFEPKLDALEKLLDQYRT